MKKLLINSILAVFVNLLLFSHLNAQESGSQFSEATVKNVKVVQSQKKEKKKKKDEDKKSNEAVKTETVKTEAVSVNRNKSRSFNVISYNAKNEIVKDLNVENYEVFVNGGEKKIDSFKSFKNGMNIVLMFDNSNSASFSGDVVKNAFIDFIDKVRPQDRLYLVSYDENVNLLATPNFDKQKVKQRIEKLEPRNGTSLYDAIDAFFSKVAIDKNLPTGIVLLTDGVDTSSRKNKFRQILQNTENYNAVFSVIYQDTFADFTAVPKANLPFGVTLGRRSSRQDTIANEMTKEEYARGMIFLNSLASSTGGRVLATNSTLEGYKKAFETIYEEFQNMNSLGFESDAENSDEIKIKVNRPNLKIITNNRLVFEDK